MNERTFSRHTDCRISDAFTYQGVRMVILENELVLVVVLPEKGAEIAAFRYKQADLDPLLHLPGGLRPPSPYPATMSSFDGAFLDYYRGGWQELFPSGGGACLVAGAEIGRHGEAALLPWNWEILEDQPDRVSVRFSVCMIRTPFVLERVMSLDSKQPRLNLEETIYNTAGEESSFMWGHHIAFGEPFLGENCSLQVPAKTVEVHSSPLLTGQRLFPGSRGNWPIMAGVGGRRIDLRQLPSPGEGSADMLYLSELSEGWYAVTNPHIGLGFACVWDIDIFPVLWMWSEFSGSSGYPWYSKVNALGLEPFTSYVTEGSSGLADVIAAGKEKRLRPGEKISFWLRAFFFESDGSNAIARISPDGDVTHSGSL